MNHPAPLTAGRRDDDRTLWITVALASLAALVALVALAVIEPRPAQLAVMAVGVAAAVGIAWEWQHDRVLSLSVVTYVFILLTFVARPAYLLANEAILGSYTSSVDRTQALSDLQGQEIVEFISSRFSGDVGAFVTKGILIGLLFTAAFLIARLGLSGTRARTPGFAFLRARPTPTALRAGVAALLGVGLVGQVLMISGGGGLGAALAHLNTQATLQQSFTYTLLASCGTVAIMLWAAYGPLRGWASVAFSGLLLELVIFGALTGSRNGALRPLIGTAIVIHLARRRWRRREVVAGAFALLVLATFALGVRQLASSRPFSEAVSTGASNAMNLGVVANDNSQFDALITLADISPGQMAPQSGGRVIAGLESLVPSGLLPGKPTAGDVAFRQEVWGDAKKAGRPYTVAGEFWLDFGWTGIAIGAALLGSLCAVFRDMGGRSFLDPSTAIVASVVLLMYWQMLNGVYSSATTILLVFGIPLILASVLFRVLAGMETSKGVARHGA